MQSMNLGEFEQIVLLAILRLGEEAYHPHPSRSPNAPLGGAEALFLALQRLESNAACARA